MAPAERVPPNTPAVERPRANPFAGPAGADAQTTTTTGAAGTQPLRKTRRANTLAPGTARPRRAPSPMGERILTGHFDGFN